MNKRNQIKQNIKLPPNTYPSMGEAMNAESCMGHWRKAAKNDVTGAKIMSSGASSQAYRDNYDRIFNKNK
jgi:hypothetical protein